MNEDLKHLDSANNKSVSHKRLVLDPSKSAIAWNNSELSASKSSAQFSLVDVLAPIETPSTNNPLGIIAQTVATDPDSEYSNISKSKKLRNVLIIIGCLGYILIISMIVLIIMIINHKSTPATISSEKSTYSSQPANNLFQSNSNAPQPQAAIGQASPLSSYTIDEGYGDKSASVYDPIDMYNYSINFLPDSSVTDDEDNNPQLSSQELDYGSIDSGNYIELSIDAPDEPNNPTRNSDNVGSATTTCANNTTTNGYTSIFQVQISGTSYDMCQASIDGLLTADLIAFPINGKITSIYIQGQGQALDSVNNATLSAIVESLKLVSIKPV